MFASALRLLSSPPSDAAVDFQIRAMGAAVGQLSKRFTRLVGGGAARCSSPYLPPSARFVSIRRGIIGVKQNNSRSIQQVAVYILRVVLPYVLLCAERQRRFDALAAGHRGPVICGDAVGSAIIFPSSVFNTQNPPPKQKAVSSLER